MSLCWLKIISSGNQFFYRENPYDDDPDKDDYTKMTVEEGRGTITETVREVFAEKVPQAIFEVGDEFTVMPEKKFDFQKIDGKTVINAYVSIKEQTDEEAMYVFTGDLDDLCNWEIEDEKNISKITIHYESVEKITSEK